MANTTQASSRRAHPTDPPQDRTATTAPDALPNLTTILRLVQILLAYGRHLVDTFDRRAAAPGFHLIARAFGTSRAAIILAHLRRGVLRAAALERVLLDRAASGRDLTRPPIRLRLKPPAPNPPAGAAQPAADPTAAPAAPPAPQPAQRKRPSHPSWHDAWLDNVDDPLDPRHLPTFEHLLAQARRRPVGRSLGDIYADLGIAPALCRASFWNDLFLAMLHHGGTPGLYDVHRWRREQHFAQEQDSFPTMDLSWPPVDAGGGRRDTLQVLGFFIGDPPVEPPLILPPEPPPWAQPAPAQPEQRMRAAPPATGPP